MAPCAEFTVACAEGVGHSLNQNLSLCLLVSTNDDPSLKRVLSLESLLKEGISFLMRSLLKKRRGTLVCFFP